MYIMVIIVIILASSAFTSLLHEIRRENRQWKETKRRHPKW